MTIKASFIYFRNIRKNTNWPIVWFICSSIIFIKWTNFSYFEVCYETSLSYTVINAINSEKKSQNSFINLVGISVDCTAFLSFKSFIKLLIWFLVTGWNVKESSEFVMCLLIQVMLGWFLYLSIILSKGSSEVFVLLKKMWLLVMPILGTIFTKWLLKTWATFTSFLIISPVRR